MAEPGTERREIHRLGTGAAGILCEDSRDLHSRGRMEIVTFGKSAAGTSRKRTGPTAGSDRARPVRPADGRAFCERPAARSIRVEVEGQRR